MITDVVKIFVPTFAAFFVGMTVTPFLTYYLFKYKMWKKKSVERSIDGTASTISASLHRDEEKKTPRMGGVVIWTSVALTTLLFFFLARLTPDFAKLDFLSRSQTWLPLFTLLVGALIGLIDDFLVVSGGSGKGGYVGGGLPLSVRIGSVIAIGFAGAWWFYFKLGVSAIDIPFLGGLELGFLFIPFFMIVMLAIYSGGVIDGIDGLSGGILATIFTAYSLIAFFQNQIDLAAFSAVVVGGILAFLWFNIPPARFYMSETGILALTTSLTVVAFLTAEVVVLPIIALPLFISSGSVILQILSKRFRHGKKIFLVAPIHHHFEAMGWPGYKVTMRFWIVGVICAILGTVIALLG